MNAKIKSLGFIVFIFVTLSIVYYEIVIQLIASKRPVFIHIYEIHYMLVKSNDEHQILSLLSECDGLFNAVEKDAEKLYYTFEVIEFLCLLNLTFLLQSMINFLFTKIMGRFFEFPTLQQFADLVLFISSIIIIRWFQ